MLDKDFLFYFKTIDKLFVNLCLNLLYYLICRLKYGVQQTDHVYKQYRLMRVQYRVYVCLSLDDLSSVQVLLKLMNSPTHKVSTIFIIWYYHILIGNIGQILPCDKTLSFVQNNKRNHVYFTQFHKNGPCGLIKQVY